MSKAFVLLLGLVTIGCGSSSTTSPTPTAPTRTLQLGGNLSFGPVPVNTTATGLLTMTNTGTATLTVSSITAPCGAMFAASFTSGPIAAGQTQNSTIQFTPTAVQSCNGVITVASDATSGSTTIPIAASGISAPAPPAPVVPAVEYRLTGTARTCSATYENATGGTNQQTVTIPFSYAWPTARSGDFLYMSCQIDQASDPGSLTVGIYKRGSLAYSGSAVGFPHIATASGSF